MKKLFWVRLALAGLIVSAAALAGVVSAVSGGGEVESMEITSGRAPGTLILDPGHGGADGGAVSVTGTYESRINLDIALRAREIAGLFGIDPIMTRESEDIAYPESARTIRAKKVWDTKGRAELVNSQDDAFFISIHQNKFTSAGPSGCQVFFAPTEGSQAIAEQLQKTLMSVAPGNRQNATQIGKDIFIMNAIKCPGVLIECGFVSNIVEAKKLEDPSYQTKLATVIIGGYLASCS